MKLFQHRRDVFQFGKEHRSFDMSVDPRRAGTNPDFSPPLPLPLSDENPVITEAAKKVSIDVNAQHSNSAPKHLKSVDSGAGIFNPGPLSNPGTVAPTGSILKRRPQSERILEPHVVHIRKTETGENLNSQKDNSNIFL